MTAAAASVAIALLLTVGGPALMRGFGRSTGAAPRSMLTVWSLATVTLLLTWIALLLMLAAQQLGPGVNGVITACVTLLQALHRNDADLGVSLTALAGVGVVARLVWVAARRAWQSAHWRRKQYRDLLSEARQHNLHHQRVWLVQDATPNVYCVPGGRFGIVVTQGAVAALSHQEMRAVLAHERAHLHSRHHLLVAWVLLLADAFPWVPLFRAAAREVPVLVEWAADDQAARAIGVNPLVHALGAMVAPGTERNASGALAASGACAVRRVRRLLSATPRRHGRLGSLMSGAAVAALTAPLVLTLVVTAITVTTAPQCPCTL